MSSLSEQIAQSALQQFAKLPLKCKPRIHPDGRREWTPLSAVVAVRGADVECLSLGTGTKCLPESALPACHGTVLHDSHAEIITLRGFNRWVLNELEAVSSDPSYQSEYIQIGLDSSSTAFGEAGNQSQLVFKDSVSFHFFTTEAPCGDASMELLIRSKPPEDALPWTGVSPTSTEDDVPLLLGRGYFSHLGAVRRKPARGDAEATISKSCTDKLTLKQFTGLLSFPADTFVSQTPNCFIQSFVVYEDRYDHAGYERAFGLTGRLEAIAHEAVFFDVSTLPASFPPFEFERKSEEAPSKASNVSALWIRGSGPSSNDTIEVLLNGVKQGFKQLDERQGKESAICRKQMWSVGLKIGLLLASGNASGPATLRVEGKLTRSYQDAKDAAARLAKKKMKTRVAHTLTGWVSNSGDEEWLLG